MNKKQILNVSIALSIMIAFFVVGTVVITSTGASEYQKPAKLNIDPKYMNRY